MCTTSTHTKPQPHPHPLTYTNRHKQILLLCQEAIASFKECTSCLLVFPFMGFGSVSIIFSWYMMSHLMEDMTILV